MFLFVYLIILLSFISNIYCFQSSFSLLRFKLPNHLQRNNFQTVLYENTADFKNGMTFEVGMLYYYDNY